MKKLALLLLVVATALLFTSCSSSKTFKAPVEITADDGTKSVVEQNITATPYGWLNKSDRIDGVAYRANFGDIFWSVIFCETIIVPILITGLDIMEPVGLKASSIKPKIVNK